MASKVQLEAVEDALIELFKNTLSVAYGQKVDVASIGEQDFADDGALVVNPPAVRLRFAEENFSMLRDNQRLTYGTAQNFELWCYDINLRSREAGRRRSMQLSSVAKDQIAGTRLRLADGTLTEPTTLISVVPMMSEEDPADQLYIVSFTVSGIAQFSGQNARPS